MNPQLASLGCVTLLASCGVGTVGIAAAADDSSSSSNAPTSIGELTVDSVKEPDALITLEVADPESNPTSVELLYKVPSSTMPVAFTTLPENPVTLATTPEGMSHPLTWTFSDEVELPDDAHFVDDVVVMARVVGGQAEAEIQVGLGNDAPVITDVQIPVGVEAVDIEAIPFSVEDSSDDVIDIRIEYNADAANGYPQSSWRLARSGGLSPGASTPDLAFEGIEAPRTGRELFFFWDTNHPSQLQDLERDVKLRFTPEDEAATGVPFETPVFSVDNNDAPSVILDNDFLVTSPDETRGIAIPFTLRDEESDDVRVVLQWRRERQAEFPELPGTIAGIEEVLDDEERRRELQVCTELPLPFEGLTRPPPATPAFDPSVQVTLPELGSTAASLLVRGVEGRTLELLRPSQRPERLDASWLENPVAALAAEGGPTALLLEAPSNGAWRLREVDLATGEVVDGHVAGASGHATAMDYQPERDAVVVASDQAGNWRVDRVDLKTWSVQRLVSSRDGEVEAGPIRGIASLGTGASLVTVGSSLVRVDYPTGPGVVHATGGAGARLHRNDRPPLEPPQAVTLLDRFATPWGIETDPLQANRIYLAETDFERADGGVGRVVTVELDTYIVEEVFVLPSTTAGAGLERPTAIALERNGARLLTVTYTNPGDGTRELRAVHINGNAPGSVYELAAGIEGGACAVGVGDDHLRLVAGGGALWVGGGVSQKRELTSYDPASRSVTVAEPFDPVPAPNTSWRIRDFVGAIRSSPGGIPNFFVWDSRDVPDGEVHLRVVPFDTDLGLRDEGGRAKRVRSFREELLEVESHGFVDAAADLNGDGRPDLVLVASEGLLVSHTSIFFQLPGSRFSSDPDVRVSRGNRAVLVDLNHDGRRDLAIPRYRDRRVELYLQPSGGFPPEPLPDQVLETSLYPLHIQAADLNRDGRADLVLTSLAVQFEHLSQELLPGGTVEIFLQQADHDPGRPFSEGPDCCLEGLAVLDVPFSSYTGDVDRDGRLDLLVGNGGELGARGNGFVSVLVQGGDPAAWPCGFSVLNAETRQTLRACIGVTPADLNGDGRLDLASVNGPISSNFFAIQGRTTWAIHFQDSGAPEGYHAEPDRLLEDPDTFSNPNYPHVEDIDADGRLDLLAAGQSSNNLTVFLQVAPGRFHDTADIVVGDTEVLGQPGEAIARDLDGDGRLDLVAQGNSTTIFRQSTSGQFSTQPDLQLGTAATTDRTASIAGGDLTGDGLIDLVTANPRNDNLTVFLQRSPGQFVPIPDQVLGRGVPTSVCIVDLNGDAELDLVCANSLRGDVTLYEQVTAGTFDSIPTVLGGMGATNGARFVRAGDLDGDGYMDVVSANRGSHTLTVFHGSDGGFADTAEPHAELGGMGFTEAPFAVAIADLEADGDLDLISANQASNSLTIFENPGGGFVTRVPPDQVLGIGSTIGPRAVVAEDLDVDGFVDIVSGNYGNPTQFNQSLTVFFQESGEFDPEPSLRLNSPRYPRSLVVGDLDADGFPDLVAANSYDQDSGGYLGDDALAVYRQVTPRRFSLTRRLASDSLWRPAAVLAADVNSDGELDLVAALHRPAPAGDPSDVIGIFFNGK